MASPGSLHKDTLSGKHTSLGWRTDECDACTSLLRKYCLCVLLYTYLPGLRKQAGSTGTSGISGGVCVHWNPDALWIGPCFPPRMYLLLFC